MKRLWPVFGLVILTFILTRSFFPKTVQGPPPPPQIVTVHDTIRDTLRIPFPVPGKATTDTLELVIRETVYDTVAINIGCEPSQRTNLWPVLTVDAGKKVGDTTIATTFGLRTGEGARIRVYTPGPLLGVYADSTPSPRFSFGPPPKPYTIRFWDKIKWGGIGYGTCTVVNGLSGLLGR